MRTLLVTTLAAFLLQFAARLAVAEELTSVPGEYVVRLRVDQLNSSVSELINGMQPLDSENRTFLATAIELQSSFSAMGTLETPFESVEPNYVYKALDLDWGLENVGQADCSGRTGISGVDVQAKRAWEQTLGSPNITVAVIDTGVSYDHSELRNQIAINDLELRGQSGVDDDQNGFVDDIYGYDFARNDADPRDENMHGTFCTSEIIANGTTNPKLRGLAPGVKVLPIRFLDERGSGTLANAVRAIDYAISRKVNIMSNSWGGSSGSVALREAIDRARKAGILFVAAAGNSGSDIDRVPVYPAAYDVDNILTVANVNNLGELARSSSFGAISADLGAPGENILGLGLNGVRCLTGTSMAAPYVSAAAALYLSVHPDASYDKVKSAIVSSATPLSSLKGKTVSGGLLNAADALNF